MAPSKLRELGYRWKKEQIQQRRLWTRTQMIEIHYTNPVSNHTHPERPDQPPEASLASSSEMAARSVDSELQSLVIEPRNLQWWSLRVCNSGDNTKTPNSQQCAWSGVKVRPGSKSRAKQYWGLLGRWESLLFPWTSTGRGESGSTTPKFSKLVLSSENNEQAGPTKVSLEEGDRVSEPSKGSLSISIVALENWGTNPRDPVSSQEGYRIMDS